MAQQRFVQAGSVLCKLVLPNSGMFAQPMAIISEAVGNLWLLLTSWHHTNVDVRALSPHGPSWVPVCLSICQSVFLWACAIVPARHVLRSVCCHCQCAAQWPPMSVRVGVSQQPLCGQRVLRCISQAKAYVLCCSHLSVRARFSFAVLDM
jgi:hypothetical protein